MKNEETKLLNIKQQLEGVEEGMNGMIIPILKDTIKDSNKHNTRIFILAMIELAIILITILVSIFLIYKQNIKYQEFLNQFDFQTTETLYQDLDSGQGDIVNPVIENKK